MSTHTGPWPDGTPCWVDLSTSDVAAAGDFYRAITPWNVAAPQDEFGGYAMADVGGRAAAGMGPAQEGWPHSWTMYFASGNAEAVANDVVRNNGSIVFPPMDVGDLGRMLIATDPTGAAFGVWQAGQHNGIGFIEEPGAFGWDDLRSTDPDTSRAFFAELFGFAYTPLDMAGPDYTTYALADVPDRPLGGMGGMMGSDASTSQWIVYFAVDDVDASVAEAGSRGATVDTAAFDSPFGRMSELTDPDGASFWLFSRASQNN